MRYFAQGYEPSLQQKSRVKSNGYTIGYTMLPKSFVTGGEER